MTISKPTTVMVSVVALLSGASIAPAAHASESIPNAATSSAGEQPQWDIGPTRPRTANEQAAIDSKIAAARNAYAARVSGRLSPAASASSGMLAANQTAQATTYYCGPAALLEALGQRHVSASQASLASSLRTTTDGTAWSGVNASVGKTTGYPVPDVMNDRLRARGDYFLYIPQAVADPASATNISDYQKFLVHDVSDNAAPVIGDAYEVVGGPHLKGHPNYKIFHWFDIRGFTNSGATTAYEDSVHGSSTSWSGSVPAYSTLPSSTIVHILGGRGYVW